MVLYQNSPLALRPVSYSEHLPVSKLWDENNRDLKHIDRKLIDADPVVHQQSLI
jgi:hypothetical protein